MEIQNLYQTYMMNPWKNIQSKQIARQLSKKSQSTHTVSYVAFQFKGNRQNIYHQTFTEAFNEAGWLSQI